MSHLEKPKKGSLISKSQFKNYLTSKELNEIQLTEVAQYSGYSDSRELISVLSKQEELASNLRSEFKNLSNVSIDVIQDAMNLVRSSLSVQKYRLLIYNPDDLCKRLYDNCNKNASAVYVAAILTCTATAIGVGAATGGVGGVLFQITCGATAYYYLDVQRDACSLNYESCIKNQKNE